MADSEDRKKRWIPQIVQLYWHCEACGEPWEWPKHKARLYCNGACKAKAYRRRKKSRLSPFILTERLTSA